MAKTVPVLRSGVLAAALLVSFASNALADRITLTGHPDYRNGPGGEFNITAADAAGKALLANLSTGYKIVNGTTVGTADGTLMNSGFDGVVGFQTFCIEMSETISLNTTYNATISTSAFNGGVGPAGDPVSIGTAYLYSLFATRVLSGYDYTNGPGRAASATLLQDAFWVLEEDKTPEQIGPNAFLNLAMAQFGGTLAGARANNNVSLYQVYALNLTDDQGALKQSQLILVPDGGVTLMLLGFGLSGLALLRRKSN